MSRDHDRIIRASRAIKHPGRNLQPASCIGAAQRAAEDDITRLVDRLMDEDWQTEPWMPPIQKLATAGPVGVIKLRCTSVSSASRCAGSTSTGSAANRGIATSRLSFRFVMPQRRRFDSCFVAEKQPRSDYLRTFG